MSKIGSSRSSYPNSDRPCTLKMLPLPSSGNFPRGALIVTPVLTSNPTKVSSWTRQLYSSTTNPKSISIPNPQLVSRITITDIFRIFWSINLIMMLLRRGRVKMLPVPGCIDRKISSRIGLYRNLNAMLTIITTISLGIARRKKMRGIRFRYTKNLLGNFSKKLRTNCISIKLSFRIHKRNILFLRSTKVSQELIKFTSRGRKVYLTNISMNHKKWVHIKNIQNQLLLMNLKTFSLVSKCIRKIRLRNFSWNKLFLIALLM